MWNKYYTNPDIRIEFPYGTDVIPEWFSEGIAQFEDAQQHYDSWDSQRDMLLRMAFLENKVLSYNQMCFFEKDGLESELVYNQGFSLTSFIAQQYGREKIDQLIDASSQNWGFSFDRVIKQVLNCSAAELYRKWFQVKDSLYQSWSQKRKTEGLIEGDSLFNRGIFDLLALWSPVDTNQLVFLSSGGNDYEIMGFYLYNQKEDELLFGKGGLSSLIDWSPDG